MNDSMRRRRDTDRVRHLMLLPSGACQAGCAYCFGPRRGGSMAPETFDAALEWIAATTVPGETIDLTFHGGEPLLLSPRWYARNLPLLRARFGARLELHLQSNLWRLDDEYCELLKAYRVGLGTSLDGPEALNDAQRGSGCFARTMAGIAEARRQGLVPGVVATFTRASAPHYRAVCEFFHQVGLGFGMHAAVPVLGGVNDGLALSPNEHGSLLVGLFDYYLANITRMRISTLDVAARGISAGQGGLCVFRECLGEYLTIDSQGDLYPCNRLVAHPEWRLGRVRDLPSLAVLMQAPAWQALHERQARVAEECGDCAHLAYCHGGCAYNALAAGTTRDPHCVAYRRLFAHITECALQQVFARENVAAVADDPRPGDLLRRGALLQVLRGGPHPQQVARRAREIVAAAALGASASVDEAVSRLDRVGLVQHPAQARRSLLDLDARMRRPAAGLGNAYVHVTYACNLTCTHCYAASGPGRTDVVMAVEDVVRVVGSARAAGFAKAVITGGEPLIHPNRERLLVELGRLRGRAGPLQVVLRTNLTVPLSSSALDLLGDSADQIVVSVDGGAATHDARRGAGTYERTIRNLHALLATEPPAQISLAATLSETEAVAADLAAVRSLAIELGVPLRVKPVLPLGRAATQVRREMALGRLMAAGCLPHEAEPLAEPTAMGRAEADELACAPAPGASCGLGANLYLAPDGTCYPCHALASAPFILGNALVEGLPALVGDRLARYRAVTVDSNRRCRACDVRYVCGGFCRAWGTPDDPDDGPCDCAVLRARARGRLRDALQALGVNAEQWDQSGLPAVHPGPLESLVPHEQ